MQGILQPGSIPRLLGELFADGRTGVVRLHRDAQHVAISLREGRIAGIEATPRQQRPKPARPLAGALEKRLGGVLRDLGISKPGPSVVGREALIDVLSWQDGEYCFEELATEVDDATAVRDVCVPELVREAVRRTGDPVVREALGDPEDRLKPGRVAALSLDLTPAEAALLSSVDGERTIREVIESAALAPEDARGALFGLLCMGAVERFVRPAAPRLEPFSVAAEPTDEEVPAAEPMPAAEAGPAEEPGPTDEAAPAAEAGQAGGAEAPAFVDDGAVAVRRQEIQEAVLSLLHADHFEVLGVSRHASAQEVKRAYLRQARRFHPDRHADPAFADLRQQVEALLIRMGEAYEVLRDPGRRARYEAELAARIASAPGSVASPGDSLRPGADEVENDFMAEEAIRRAEQHMVEAQYFDAIQILEAVIPRIRSMRLKHAAQVRLARAYARNPYWVRRGEEILKLVVREDPACGDAYFVLGTIYQGSGLRNRAIAMFRKVLELKPNHGPTLAQIRSLESPGGSKKALGRS